MLERGGSCREGVQLVDGVRVHDRRRDDLLRQHIERVPREGRLLDRARMHPLDDHRGLDEVTAVLREEDALAGLADLVTRPPDPLEPAGDAGGLSTWTTRSTAPMSMPSSSELVATSAGRRPALSSSSIWRRCSRAMLPWCARTSSSPASSLRRCASRSARRRLLVKTIVLRWARIASRMRGWMAGQMELRASAAIAGPPGWSSGGSTSPSRAMSSTGTMTWRSSAFRVPASTISTCRSGPMPPRNAAMRSSGRWVALRPMRCGGATVAVLRRSSPQVLQAFQREREVRAALGAGDGVHLVDDHVLHTGQDLPGLAGQQQVQALRRGDEDVGRVAREVAADVGGRVAGADADRDVGRGLAQPLRREADARERGTQVALDVVGQGLERADVQDADAAAVLAAGLRSGMGDEAIERPEEGGEGLAAAGRRVDERVLARRDGRPAAVLRLRGPLERALEPLADGRAEAVERIIGRRRTRGPGRRDHRTDEYRS